LFSVIGLGLLLAGFSKQEAPKVLARVGDRAITVDDFQREVERLRKGRKPVPDKATLLQEMVQFEAQLLRARKAGLADDPQIQREMGLLLIGKLRDRELAPRLEAIEITPDEAKAEYQQHLDKYTQPAKVRLALLHLKAAPTLRDARRAELRQRLEEARRKTIENPPRGGRNPATSGFGALALEYSDDQASRHRGGDIGWLDAGNFQYRWPRPVLAAAYALEKGELTPVIEAEEGFYLAMKIDARELRVTPFAQVEATIRHSLLLKKRREMEEAFREEARRIAGVQTDEKVLATLEPLRGSLELAEHREPRPPALPDAGSADAGDAPAPEVNRQ
jgi:parvulin-like peptidyl-prolyl isomerase